MGIPALPLNQALQLERARIHYRPHFHRAQLAIRRVAQRVKDGGHNIPTPTIIRRFKRGQQLFPEYCALADEWYSYRSSDGTFHLTDEAFD